MIATKLPSRCNECNKYIELGKDYVHNQEILCEECYMNVRIPYRRKPHWQYIRSIKTKYLIPSKKSK